MITNNNNNNITNNDTLLFFLNTTISPKHGWESKAVPMTTNQKTAIGIFLMNIIVTAVVFNSILTFTIISSPNGRLLTVPNILIVNMSVGDLITSIFVVPFDVDLLMRGVFPFGEVMCGFREIAFLLSLPSSVNCLLLLTLERFISIVYPFQRIRYIRKRTTAIAIIFGWTYSLSFALMPLGLMNPAVAVINQQCYFRYPLIYIYIMLTINFMAPICAIVVMNLVLFCVASKHAGDMKRRSLVGTKQKVRPSIIKLGASLKAAKTILVLVAVFLVCWLTFIVLGLLNIMCGICHPRYITYLGTAINYTSISLNPFLYGLRNSEIRRQAGDLMNRLLKKCCPGYKKFQGTALDSSRSATMAESEYTSYYKPGSDFFIGVAKDGSDIDFNGNENKSREEDREAIQLLETKT